MSFREVAPSSAIKESEETIRARTKSNHPLFRQRRNQRETETEEIEIADGPQPTTPQ